VTAAPVPLPRPLGACNWRGVWALYRRDVTRFLRYAGESLGGPVMSSLMFLAVFELSIGGREMLPGVPLGSFIAPGLVVFSLAHSAYENAAVPMLYDKMEGMIGDILSAPLRPAEIVLAYTLSGASNGLLSGAVVLALLAVFVDLTVPYPLLALAFGVLGAVLFAQAGLIVGIWADRWDGYSAAETFVVLPLGLLSGAFFTLDTLPEAARWAVLLNPTHHVVNGLRYALVGAAEGSLWLGVAALIGLVAALAALAWRMVATGYKIKS
jgi:ABC-2 type transport system permease protein